MQLQAGRLPLPEHKNSRLYKVSDTEESEDEQ